MKWQLYLRRVIPTTLSVGCCLLLLSCASGNSRPSLSLPPGKTDTTGLTGEELRKAKAMAHYATGISLELRQSPDAALSEFSRAHELDPHNLPLAYRLAHVYAQRKDYTNAVAILNDIIRENPESPDPWYWLGVIYRSADQTPNSVHALERALQLDPGQLIALQYLLGIQIQHPTVKTDAIRYLERARQHPSTNWMYWSRLGDLYAYILKQKPSLADSLGTGNTLRCYEKANALAPNEPEILSRLGAAYEESNDYAKAATAYATLLKLHPTLPGIQERLAYAYLQSDQPTNAIAIYTDILKAQPLRYEIYNSLGEVYEEIEKDADAISAYQQSLAINANQFAPALRIALLQIKSKHYEDALKSLDAAKTKYPLAFQIPYFKGLIYADLKQYDQAVAAFTDAQSLAETATEPIKLEATFYYHFGSACERAGQFDRAATLFRKTIELAPDRPDAYNYLGYMWAEQGINLDEAHSLIKKAVAIEPDNPAYLDSLGWVLYKLNRPAEALPHLRRAVELQAKEPVQEQREDATLLDHLAEILATLGKRDEAIALWERALKIEPGNKAIAEKLQRHRKQN
jgi:tetratricopeptide (TPR) repeat protein